MPISIPIKIPRKLKPTCHRLNPWFFVKTILKAPKYMHKTPKMKAQNIQRQRHIGWSVSSINGL